MNFATKFNKKWFAKIELPSLQNTTNMVLKAVRSEIQIAVFQVSQQECSL